MVRGDLGMISTRSQKNKVPAGVTWCADNECFNGKKYSDATYYEWLRSWDAEARSRCLFATAPDIVGDAPGTLARSTPWLGMLRALGFPVGFVGQDGVEDMLYDIPWDDIDVWFTGGSTEWKLSPEAAMCANVARAHGLRTHMGRVNTKNRIVYAYNQGYDSVDGTTLTFGPDRNLPPLLRWLEEVHQAPPTG